MAARRVPAMVVAAALVVSGCASRPSEAELAESILVATENDPALDVSAERASCMAQMLLGSSLSDTSLSGLADDFGMPEVLETEVDDIKRLVSEAALSCEG